MIKETHECRECGSSNIIKNGHSASGSQQYHCKDCGAHKVLDPEPRGYSEEEKEKILRAYRERGSKRAISRIFGISRHRATQSHRLFDRFRTYVQHSSSSRGTTTPLNSKNAGHTSENGRTNAGSGSLYAVELDKS